MAGSPVIETVATGLGAPEGPLWLGDDNWLVVEMAEDRGCITRVLADGTLQLTVRDVAEAVPALLDHLRSTSVQMKRLTTHHATLEDVFLVHAGHSLVETDTPREAP